jgi:hypothetical protein
MAVPLCVVCYENHDDSGANDIKTALESAVPAILIDNTSYSLWGGNGGYGGSANCIPASYIALGTEVYSYITGGYEGTSYGDTRDDITDNETRIAGMAATDGATGVFLDEVSSSPDAAGQIYLQAIKDACTAAGLKLIFNTGVSTFDTWLTDRCDFIMTDEQYNGRGPTASEGGVIDQVLVIRQTQNTPVLTAVTAAANTNAALEMGFSYSYACNFYVTLPAWLVDYANLLGQIGGSNPPPPVGVFDDTVGGIFDDTWATLTYEVDDREIYNDVRSEIEITEETIVTPPGSDPVYAYGQTRRGIGDFDIMEEKDVWTENLTGLSGLTFMDGWGEGGVGFTLRLTATLVSVDTVGAYTHAVYHVVNDSGSLVVATLVANYMYTVAPAYDGTPHTDTNQRTLTVRTTDATSIAKYGRRTMNLTWPMGQTQAQMQALVDSYISRFSEPIPRITMTVQGSTDAMVIHILTRKVSDKITVLCAPLGLAADFWIDSIEVSHNVYGILEAQWVCEQVRGSEQTGLFVISTSELDSTAILG